MKPFKFKTGVVDLSSLDFYFDSAPENSFIERANWVGGSPLSDDELDALTEALADLVHEAWYEHKVCEAEYMADSISDR